MASIDEIRQSRLQKLELLKKAGVDPYPPKVPRDMCLRDARENFDKFSKENKIISLTGRIMAIRGQGAILFVVLDDGKAKLQTVFKKDTLDEKLFKLFGDTADIGDFISVTGTFFVTQRGEQSLLVASWTMAAKSLLPLPEKWHGLEDEEIRLRKRYLDIITNPEVRDIIQKRSMFWKSVRDFLLKEGFMEVETPVLENVAGGADARPFVTHHNALNIDVFLRISPELWLKRLMVAGFQKVFEIGRIFRNEGMSLEHLQDYTQMEFYWAYADYNDGMKIVEELYKYVAQNTFGTLKFKIRGFDVDLGAKWAIYDYTETIKKETGVDISKASLKDVEAKLRELKVEYDSKGINMARAVDTLWKYCRKKISGPGFLINVPVFLEPLAKRSRKDDSLVERFQVLLAGSEMGKGFSELNDPLDQAGRFEDQAKLREAGDEEAQMNDTDFVEALEHGMPPTCGFGFSERLFSFLIDKPAREAQIFPLMRPKESVLPKKESKIAEKKTENKPAQKKKKK
jgi:lysyl-tRNA synthetase class 2